MSPFSKVEMSPFVILKLELQHERCGAGGAPTTNEPERANAAGSYSTSQTKDPQTTPGGRAVVDFSAAGETVVQNISGQWSRGPGFQTTRPVLKQSSARENHQQGPAVTAVALS